MYPSKVKGSFNSKTNKKNTHYATSGSRKGDDLDQKSDITLNNKNDLKKSNNNHTHFDSKKFQEER